jgi:hypothetical protein
MPFRYYLGLDGKLRSYMAQIAFSATAGASTDFRQAAMEAHFRSLWSSTPTGGSTSSPVVGNVKNIVVAPDNLSAYVLKSGLISQYRSCSDRSVSVTTAGGTTYAFPGTPDCDLATTGTIRKEWPINPNIESIAVDFKSLTNLDDDVIYGLFNSGATEGATAGTGILQKGTTPLPVSGTEIAWANTVAGDGISNIPYLPRIRGIFLGQTFPALASNAAPNLFVIDNTCYAPGSNADQQSWVYCVSIFNAADAAANLDVGNLPVQVQSVSY